ncbi:MAG: hypothetical protein AMXMBFR7_33020 [Planctomycetota bacterium]
MSVLLLADAKAWLEVSHSAQDSVIQLLIDGAEDWVSRECGIALASAARQEDLDGGQPWLYPTFLPITALATVTDLPAATTWPAAVVGENKIARTDEAGRVLAPGPGDEAFRPYKEGWWGEGAKRWRVNYTGGYASIPPGLKIAIFQLVSRAYHQRSGEGSSAAAGAALMWPKLMDSVISEMLAPYRKRPRVRTW